MEFFDHYIWCLKFLSFFLADSALVNPEATESKSAKHTQDITSDVATTLLQLISQQASESRRPAADLCPGRGPSSPPSATPPPANAAPETQFTQDQDLRYTLGGAAGPSWTVLWTWST